MKQDRIINVVLIGCGDIALSGHLPALLAHPRFRLVGICDICPESIARLRSVLERLDGNVARSVKSSTDYRTLLPLAGACVVALHPEHSVEVVIDLLRRRIPVLDEKPLAGTLEDGKRIMEAVEESGTVYQLGFVLRYCTLIREALGRSRRLGAPCFYQVSIYDEAVNPANAAHFHKIQRILEQSLMITHEGSHVIDWMSDFTQASIQSVNANAIKTRQEFMGNNLWACNFGYDNGSMLQLTIGWFLTEQPPSTFRVIGPEGFLDLDLFKGEGFLRQNGRVESFVTEPLQQAWQPQLDAFVEAIDTNEVRHASVHEGLKALKATLACEASLRNNMVTYV